MGEIKKINKCETPKSPPGDYNSTLAPRPTARPAPRRVKHLNPRQGITTDKTANPAPNRDWCETPKSPPGDYNLAAPRVFIAQRLKCETPKSPPGDYNSERGRISQPAPSSVCETPKSPPGDYNICRRLCIALHSRRCETPKSPPGDYNSSSGQRVICTPHPSV